MLFAVILGLVAIANAVQTSQTYKGLEITVSGLERAKRVSLQDCPPGENSVRGVIRPSEDNEFAVVAIDVQVSAADDSTEVPQPILHDDAGNAYKTAQSFTDVASEGAYTCNFSFRVPTGTKVVRFSIDDISFDVSELEK